MYNLNNPDMEDSLMRKTLLIVLILVSLLAGIFAITTAQDDSAANLNWCSDPDIWGDGRCNAPELNEGQVAWFWACGWYWAHYAAEEGLTGDPGKIIAKYWEEYFSQYDDPPVPAWCAGEYYEPDTDGDGWSDLVDACPYDPHKWDNPGVCGCGALDIDTDGDGFMDCVDACPTEKGVAPDGCPDEPEPLCWSTGDLCYDAGFGSDGCVELTAENCVVNGWSSADGACGPNPAGYPPCP